MNILEEELINEFKYCEGTHIVYKKDPIPHNHLFAHRGIYSDHYVSGNFIYVYVKPKFKVIKEIALTIPLDLGVEESLDRDLLPLVSSGNLKLNISIREGRILNLDNDLELYLGIKISDKSTFTLVDVHGESITINKFPEKLLGTNVKWYIKRGLIKNWKERKKSLQ